MNIYLLYADKPFCEYEKYLPYVSPERLEKIHLLKDDCQKKLSLLSHLFARYKIAETLSIPFKETVILYDSHGKPYVEGDNYHFSLSHCDNAIAFVSHTSPVGIDIQKIESTISSAIRFFTENEKNYVNFSSERFFEVWTKKEAYIKMLGTGLSTPLSSFDVLHHDISGLLFSTHVDSFSLSICAKNVGKIDILREYV